MGSNLLELLVLLVIAGICGSIAELIVGFSPGGFLVSSIIGVIGAYLGTFIAARLNAPSTPFNITIGGNSFDLIYATLGSILFLLIFSLIRSGRARRPIRRR